MHLDTNEKCMSVQQKTVCSHPQSSGLYTADEHTARITKEIIPYFCKPDLERRISLYHSFRVRVNKSPLKEHVTVSFCTMLLFYYELKLDAQLNKGEFAAGSDSLTAKQQYCFTGYKTHESDLNISSHEA